MPTSPARPIGLPPVATRQSAVEAYTQDPEARCDDDPTLKNFRFTLRFRTDNVSDEGGSVRWQLVEAYLPPSYPDAPPEVHLRDTCLLEALQELERLVHTAVEAGELPMAKRCREPDGVVEAGANASLVECPEIRVAFVWMHHLLSTTKRKQICQWSAELGLYGKVNRLLAGV
ncbi:hypothetical protein IWQ60_001025 [Tieghemiomyces parasiticus]|uniref:RWD domain-containing protein n=1 Tax=Tieghemiomyces parasiticus TaxID=78921 RepID=A0A9W8AHR7_9FUNG|nr:hypothetical protein IWQ60_001025 [Tieghemiomyces parasiticus]